MNLGILKEYQIDRFTSFVDPGGADAQGNAYNQEQSKQAIAHGRFAGEGLGEGSQTQGGFVPEQHTDFIFTSVGEELGFLGAVVLLGLFAIVMWRTWRTARLSRDFFGALVCVGVLSMLAFQMFENTGMTMGIMPITGIPLPVRELRRVVAHHQLRLHRPRRERVHEKIQLGQSGTRRSEQSCVSERRVQRYPGSANARSRAISSCRRRRRSTPGR